MSNQSLITIETNPLTGQIYPNNLVVPSASLLLNSYINVVNDLGADPTGVKDSTTALQTAFQSSKQCYIPVGTYLINAPLTSSQNVSIVGAGMGVVTFVTSQPLYTMIYQPDGVGSVKLSGFSMYGGNVAQYGMVLGQTTYCFYSTFSDIGAFYFTQAGLRQNSSEFCIFNECAFNNNYIGMLAASSSNGQPENTLCTYNTCVFGDNTFSGVYLQQYNAFRFNCCDFESNIGYGIFGPGNTGPRHQLGVVFDSCNIENNARYSNLGIQCYFSSSWTSSSFGESFSASYQNTVFSNCGFFGDLTGSEIGSNWIHLKLGAGSYRLDNNYFNNPGNGVPFIMLEESQILRSPTLGNFFGSGINVWGTGNGYEDFQFQNGLSAVFYNTGSGDLNGVIWTEPNLENGGFTFGPINLNPSFNGSILQSWTSGSPQTPVSYVDIHGNYNGNVIGNVTGNATTATTATTANGYADFNVYTETRNLTGNIGDWVQLGYINYGYTPLHIELTFGGSNMSFSKTYILNSSYGNPNGIWSLTEPISAFGQYSGNDFDLDISGSNTGNSPTALRLRRSAGNTTGGSVTAKIYQFGASGNYWVSTPSVSGTGASTPTTWQPGSVLQQSGNQISIFSPLYFPSSISSSISIGTTSSLGKLDIRPDSSWTTTEAIVSDTDGNNNPRIRMYRPVGDGTNSFPVWIRNNGTSGEFDVATGATAVPGSETMTSRFTILSGGNVGVGTTNPQALLHVFGNISASNFIGSASYSTTSSYSINSTSSSYALTAGTANSYADFNVYTENRNLTTNIGDYVTLGSTSVGWNPMYITLFFNGTNLAFSKTYNFAGAFDGLNGWSIAEPIAAYGPYGGNDFDLDISSSASGTATLRVRRSAGSSPGGTLTAKLYQFGPTENVWTSLPNLSGSTTVPTTYVQGAVIQQSGNQVSVFSPLYVNGNISASVVTASLISTLTASAAPSNTSTIQGWFTMNISGTTVKVPYYI